MSTEQIIQEWEDFKKWAVWRKDPDSVGIYVLRTVGQGKKYSHSIVRLKNWEDNPEYPLSVLFQDTREELYYEDVFGEWLGPL